MQVRAAQALLALGFTLCASHAFAWTTLQERPPRLGDWFYVEQMPPSLNFLVPHGTRYRYFKPQPWTKEWYGYCAARHPSFNPSTGTVRTPDGLRMCF